MIDKSNKLPKPLLPGTQWNGLVVLKVVTTDLTDPIMPYCYKMNDGSEVWILAKVNKKRVDSDESECQCAYCQGDNEELNNPDYDDVEDVDDE